MGEGTDGRGPGKAGSREPPLNAFEVTLHEFHEDLKLSAEQEPLWQRYEDKLRALIDDLSRERNRKPEQLGVMQKIDRTVDAARNRAAALEEIGDAAKALYAKLSPEQQAAADPRLANVMLMPLELGAPQTRGQRPSGPPPR